MTARTLIALALLALQGLAWGMGRPAPQVAVWVCVIYLVITLVTRLWLTPPPARAAGVRWLWVAGVDLLVFALLHWWQEATSYTPLFVVPETLRRRGFASICTHTICLHSTRLICEKIGRAHV